MRSSIRVFAAAMAVACVLLPLLVASAEAVVDLAYFEVEDREDGVLVTWGTGNELTTYGFNLHRATVDDFSQSGQLNEGTIEATGSIVGGNYSYPDPNVETGTTYYYWLEILDFDKSETRGPESVTHGPAATATSTPSPTRTPTFTPTSLPVSTPTPTATVAPTATSVPSVTPTLSATSLPGSSPSPTPTATRSPGPSSPASPPATALPTTSATAQPPSVPTPEGSQPTATSLPPAEEDGGVLAGSSQSRGASFSWPSISVGTVLLLISVTSFLAALVVLAAYLLMRRFGA